MKPIRGGLLWGSGAVLVFLALASSASATFPGANGLIVYAGTAPHGNDIELFTISPSAGTPTQLTHDSVHERDPSWSADGRKIVFSRAVSRHVGPRYEIWTMYADGTHKRRVTGFNGLDASHPSFSPSGGRIAARLIADDGTSRIATVRTDGTDRVRIPGTGEPRYTPDGRIVFNGTFARTGKYGIWVVRPDGSHARLILNQHRELGVDPDYSIEDFGPDMSPDGRHIIYYRCTQPEEGGCSWDLAIVRSDGRFERIVTDGREPVFSPDGSRIAATDVTCDGLCVSKLFTTGLNGHGSHDLVNPPSPAFSDFWINGPSWQPIPPA